MAHIASRIHSLPRPLHTAAAVLVLTSFGIKIGLVPFHVWQAPAYHAAGSTTAAMLSGVMMKVNVYALLRILRHVLRAHELLPGIMTVLLVAGMVNILVGHLAGLASRDLKRMLAFSSVAHTGYILVGAGAAGLAGSAVGLTAGLYHVVNHAVMKPALFWSGRGFMEEAGSSRITALRGTAGRRPIEFAAFFLATLAIVGVPPTGGFVTKWLISVAAFEAAGPVPVLVVAAGTVISLYYYGRVFRITLSSSTGGFALPPLSPHTVVVVLFAVGTLVLGLGAGGILPFVEEAARRLLDAESYRSLVPGGS